MIRQTTYHAAQVCVDISALLPSILQQSSRPPRPSAHDCLRVLFHHVLVLFTKFYVVNVHFSHLNRVEVLCRGQRGRLRGSVARGAMDGGMSGESYAIGQEALVFDRMFRVMRTVGEMMRDRKYNIACNVIPESVEQFREWYTDQHSNAILRERMTVPCERVCGPQRSRAMVFFSQGLGMEAVKQYIMTANSDNCDRLIIVTSGKVNATVKRHVDDVNRTGVALKIQLFDEDDLVVNITHHELVPKHTQLEEEEEKEMLQSHSLEKSMLPRILSTDPVAAYLGLERGRVVRIERKSMSAGFYVTYRQVV
ncbi:putative DNA-directed RNA polymerases II subunit [Trypanosoma vivax]|uniref:Putative DNA-directed RNA polymerases II subunit n=1 Tax=Trypanosoma vivax (strain Y486) TaxID=1055687 RepID=G0U485_TRYVY|nr:putative DNA-directed RNA polymerases II subunit [Trypanosoma vivax]CCC52248.1 putative DNA-directed RNA polymerases II subunit [Trypanosoma vivax Y486]